MIHPKIQKFFESNGSPVNFNGEEYFQFTGWTGHLVARVQKDGSLKYYYFGERTEKEMLRIIELKAFL